LGDRRLALLADGLITTPAISADEDSEDREDRIRDRIREFGRNSRASEPGPGDRAEDHLRVMLDGRWRMLTSVSLHS
jgi:hypothetical protein